MARCPVCKRWLTIGRHEPLVAEPPEKVAALLAHARYQSLRLRTINLMVGGLLALVAAWSLLAVLAALSRLAS